MFAAVATNSLREVIRSEKRSTTRPTRPLTELLDSTSAWALNQRRTRREEVAMARPVQGGLSLLDDPAAQRLLESTEVAHLAYNWSDGTPRCTPIWFHWSG